MPIVTLTELTIRNLKAPDTEFLIYSDRSFKGFGVRVSKQGSKSYVVSYGCRGNRKRVTLGKFETLSLKAARKKAMDF